MEHNVQIFKCDGVETFEEFQTGRWGGGISSHLGAAFGFASAVGKRNVSASFFGNVYQLSSAYTFIVHILHQQTALQILLSET